MNGRSALIAVEPHGDVPKLKNSLVTDMAVLHLNLGVEVVVLARETKKIAVIHYALGTVNLIAVHDMIAPVTMINLLRANSKFRVSFLFLLALF